MRLGGGGGGGGIISASILGGAQNTFSYYFFVILKILGGGGMCPQAPLLRGPCLEMFRYIDSALLLTSPLIKRHVVTVGIKPI